MTTKLRNLKGTEDFLPQRQRIRLAMIRKLQDVFERYGYQPMETPTICYFDVLASKYAGGAEILKEVYRLTDQGERILGLRYDLTVPFARVVGMNPDIRMPFKRYEIGKVYRDGPVKTGRNREFIQCDVDVVGVQSMMAEAELMTMAVEVYRMLGLPIYISYNNRKLLSGVLQLAGIGPGAVSGVILCIDKLEKIGADGVRAELIQQGLASEQIDLLFDYMKMEADAFIQAMEEKGKSEQVKEGLKELKELIEYGEILGISDTLKFTPSLARGLEIYTGTVWEVFLEDRSIASSVGAGGRYDRIIGEFIEGGREFPAVGMTFGLDVMYEALLQKGNLDKNPPVDLLVIPLGTEKNCLKLVAKLRGEGLRVDIEMTGRKLKKTLDYGNKEGIPFVVVLGEDEWETELCRIKDMKKGLETQVRLEDLGPSMKGMLE